jgi:glucose-1-phosphate cytidylyltransferase
MKVVILCGGKGTRLREETEFKPKPLVTIGRMPILWHIMKIYSHYGHKEFIILLGYKGEMIKRYFIEHHWRGKDFCLDLGSNQIHKHNRGDEEDWKIHFVDTGLGSATALRLFKAKHLLQEDEDFLLTYGDGVGDININELINHHKQKGAIATLSGLRPRSKYGVMDCSNGYVLKFREKPVINDVINGGFMVFNKKIFNHLDGRDVMLVEDTLPKLASFNELILKVHDGFWHCMDTYKDYKNLNKIWSEEPNSWKIWK